MFQMFPYLEDTHKAFLSCRQFIRDVLPQHIPRLPRILKSLQLVQETGNDASRIVRDDGAEIPTAKSACEEFTEDMGSRTGVKGGESLITKDDESPSPSREPFRSPSAWNLPLMTRKRSRTITVHENSAPPPPMIRAQSHPDMADLCGQWAENRESSHAKTTTYKWSDMKPERYDG